jgi:uncharacterized membrane protein
MVTIDGLFFTVTLIAALGCGVMGGLFFAFSVSVMKALARLPSAAGIAAMQSINVAIINPVFLTAFFGTAAACVLVMIASVLQGHDPGVIYLLLGTTLYLVGTFLVTLVFNVPKNKALASITPADSEGASLWADYLSKWTAWNHVRTTAALASAALLTIAIGYGPALVGHEQAGRASLPTISALVQSSAMKGEKPLRALSAARHISVPINRPPLDVYNFVSNPENLPKWATGLGQSITNVNGEWIAESPMGKAKIRFAERNTFGILDHDVVLESGVKIHNPMRVVPNGNGSEIIFTLLRQSDMSDEKFSQDAKWVEKDLRTLKAVLEK